MGIRVSTFLPCPRTPASSFTLTNSAIRYPLPVASTMNLSAQPFMVLLLVALLLGEADAARAQIYAFPQTDTSQASAFGIAVAIDGERALVGASGEHTCGPNGGAAYVYVREASTDTWHQTARLTPSQCQEDAFFGQTLDVSGNRAVVGASSEFFAERKSNAAYIFERNPTGAWNEVARLTAEQPYDEGSFAADVAIDGDRVLVTTAGSPEGSYGGAAYVFEYDRIAREWTQVARLTASAGVEHGVLGGACALDGDRFVVAASTYFARKPGSVYVFERSSAGRWREAARIEDVEDFFISVALDGNHMLVGEAQSRNDRSGEATVYRRTASGRWIREATLRPSTPYSHGAFGSDVSLFGDRALVTGYDEQLGQDFNIDRVVYVFERHAGTTTWTQQQIIDIGEVDFGTALDQNASFALISMVPDDEIGTVYVVRLF